VNPIGIVSFALLGLVIASACWVLAYAQANKLALFGGPVCAACTQPLPPLAWLPFWGFGTARRCAACAAEQPVRRVAFEAIVAAYFALVAVRTDDARQLAAIAAFSVPLLVIFLVDWWTRYIYTNVIYAGLLIGLAFAALDGLESLLHAVAGAAGGAGIFLGFYVLAALIYRNVKAVPFGIGDVYLAGVIGAMIGSFLAVVAALFYGIFFAAAGAVLLIVLRRVQRRDPIPYGPYLCLGAFVALLQQVG
jgi:leader peptidase (prepilin peptidase) / N-methyltransferase